MNDTTPPLGHRLSELFRKSDPAGYFSLMEAAGRVPNIIEATRLCTRSATPLKDLAAIVACANATQKRDPEFLLLATRDWTLLPRELRDDSAVYRDILNNPRFLRSQLHTGRKHLVEGSAFGDHCREYLPVIASDLLAHGVLGSALVARDWYRTRPELIAAAMARVELTDLTTFFGGALFVPNEDIYVRALEILVESEGLRSRLGVLGLHVAMACWMTGTHIVREVELGILDAALAAMKKRPDPKFQAKYDAAIAVRKETLRSEDLLLSSPFVSEGRKRRAFLCITGQLRDFRAQAAHALEIFRPLNPVPVIHCWRQIGLRTINSPDLGRVLPEPLASTLRHYYDIGQVKFATADKALPHLAALVQKTDLVTAEELQDVYRTPHVEVEDLNEPRFIGVPNAELMFYKFSRGLRAIEALEPRDDDIVVRLRPDHRIKPIENGCDLGEMCDRAAKGRVVFVAGPRGFLSGTDLRHPVAVPNDNFAIGAWRSMKVYLSVYDWAKEDPRGVTLATPYDGHDSLGWRLFTSNVRVLRSGWAGTLHSSRITDRVEIRRALAADQSRFGIDSAEWRMFDRLLKATPE